MADILEKIKDLIAKIIKIFKDLIAKITGGEDKPDETTGA